MAGSTSDVGMTEVLFYHLERRPLERVLPQLLSKCLERGWRAVVETSSEERAEALSATLWTYTEESFLPHGTDRDGNADLQPVWIGPGPGTPNEANVRFLVDGASQAPFGDFERIVYLFDGRDEEAVAAARLQWKDLQAAGHDVTYWRENEKGQWQKSP